MAANVCHCLNAGRWIGHDARPICDGLTVRGAESGDCLGLRHLVGQHVTERPEFRQFKLAIAHRLDFGVVTGGDKDLDLAADHR